MAVFNGQEFVEATIGSLQRQTLSDWELVVVDDGSEDCTPAILASLARADPRISVITQTNAGLTAALNRGLTHAKGIYLARIDAGDLARANRLALQKAFLDTHADHVAVGSHLLWITREGWPVGEYRVPLEHDVIDGQHIGGIPGQMAHGCLMMRLDTLRSIGGYVEHFVVAQDYDLLLRLAEVGKLANLDEILTKYRVDPDGVSSRRRDEQIRLVGDALVRARRRRGMPALATHPPLWTFRSSSDLLAKWVREALLSGYYSTARRYAWRLLRSAFSVTAVRLLLRALYEEARGNALGSSRVPGW